MVSEGIILLLYREAEEPYLFESTGTVIYSIEELSYYIFHNIYLFTEEMIDEKLIKWLEDNIKADVLAQKLRTYKKQGNDLKDIVTTILCSNDFYSEKEIKFLIGIMEDMEKLSMPMKRKMKADALIMHRNYQGAALEYEGILKLKCRDEFTREEYGNLLHNLGVAHVHTASLQEAAREFKEAYVCNQREESKQCYLMALKLAGKDELFDSEADKMGVLAEEKAIIRNRMETAGKESRNLPISRKLRELKELKVIGRVNDYYRGIDYIIEKWKEDYRREVI